VTRIAVAGATGRMGRTLVTAAAERPALTLALARGYYESPRQVSTDELAEELGISQPATSDLLRRAERQLMSSALGSEAHLNALSR
jgi:predicted DNA binding protein